MTYRQNYQALLEGQMAKGGTPKQMEEAVTEFNAIENPDYKPSKAFISFVRASTHICSTCGQMFTVSSDIDTVTVLDQETVCGTCSASI